MPTFKQKKSGGYFIHARGKSNPVNTFQIHDPGVSIVLDAGIDPGDDISWDLFWLLDDLDQLYFKGDGDTESEVPDLEDLDDVSLAELTLAQRCRVVESVLNEFPFDAVQRDPLLKLIVSLLEAKPQQVGTITNRILEPTGIPADLDPESWHPIEFALCHYYLQRFLVDQEMVSQLDPANDRELVAIEDGIAYFLVESADWTKIAEFNISNQMPDVVADSTDWMTLLYSGGFDHFHSKAFSQWVAQKGFVGKALATYVDEHGSALVLPENAVEIIPSSEPVQNELSELYEAVRILSNVVERVLKSEKTEVSFDDQSPMLTWYGFLLEYLGQSDIEHLDGAAIGEQQATRNEFSMADYRERFGNGDMVTEFEFIDVTGLDEAMEMKMYGLNILDPAETVIRPIAPESGEPLPVYPRSEGELENAVNLLDEFPDEPAAADSSIAGSMPERLRL